MYDILLTTLFTLSAFDIRYKRVPNVIIYLFVITKTLLDIAPLSPYKKIISVCQVFLIGTILFIFYVILSSKRVKVAAGDIKIIYLIIVFLGIDAGLEVILLSLLVSIIPLAASREKVPMAPFFLIGYIVYLLK